VHDSAYEDQIREARARMQEEGEAVPAPQPSHGNGGNGAARPQGPRPDGGRNGSRRGGRNRNGGGRNPQQRGAPGAHRPQSRGARPPQWDPRKTEKAYREPADHSYQQAQPTTVVKVTHKPKRTLVGFVGALLGRKPEEPKGE